MLNSIMVDINYLICVDSVIFKNVIVMMCFHVDFSLKCKLYNVNNYFCVNVCTTLTSTLVFTLQHQEQWLD